MLSICTDLSAGLSARRRGLDPFVGLALAALSVTATPAFAQSICNAGNQIVVSLVEVTASCTITGSLTIQGGHRESELHHRPHRLATRGGGCLGKWCGSPLDRGRQVEIQQNYNQHRKMSTTDDATIVLKNATMVLNQGVGNKFMFYNAFDKIQDVCRWLDAQLRSTSSLISESLSEIRGSLPSTRGTCARDLYQGAFDDQHRRTGFGYRFVWLNFEDGASGTIDLPAQTAQADAGGELGPYPGVSGVASAGLSGVR